MVKSAEHRAKIASGVKAYHACARSKGCGAKKSVAKKAKNIQSTYKKDARVDKILENRMKAKAKAKLKQRLMDRKKKSAPTTKLLVGQLRDKLVKNGYSRSVVNSMRKAELEKLPPKPKGGGAKKPVRKRRTKKEMAEAKAMGMEDRDAPKPKAKPKASRTIEQAFNKYKVLNIQIVNEPTNKKYDRGRSLGVMKVELHTKERTKKRHERLFPERPYKESKEYDPHIYLPFPTYDVEYAGGQNVKGKTTDNKVWTFGPWVNYRKEYFAVTAGDDLDPRNRFYVELTYDLPSDKWTIKQVRVDTDRQYEKLVLRKGTKVLAKNF
jgi:hypothetical protein